MYTTLFAINAAGINKQYESFNLKNVDIQVKTGTVVGFVGQNGAGKTTTIKSLLNVIKPDSGCIEIFGQNIYDNETKIKDAIGIVYDDLAFPDMLNASNIGKILSCIYSQWNMETYLQYLETFSIPLKRKVGKLSRGMRMKLQIATALSHNAKLLIMDEPTSGLDPVVRSEILDIFMDFMQDESHTIFLSSHILSDLEKIADSIIFINNGEILINGDKDSLLESHGIIKCSKEQAVNIDSKYVISKHEYSYGVEILTDKKQEFIEFYPTYTIDSPTLEEIILLYLGRR